MSITSLDDIKNAFYINLEHRTDRKEHVENECYLHRLDTTADLVRDERANTNLTA